MQCCNSERLVPKTTTKSEVCHNVSILFVWKQNCCLWCSLIMMFVHHEWYIFNHSVVNYICKHFVSCRWNWIVHLPIFTLAVHNIHMNIWDFNPLTAKSSATHNCLTVLLQILTLKGTSRQKIRSRKYCTLRLVCIVVPSLMCI